MVHRPFDPDEIRSSKVKGRETGRQESTEAPWHAQNLDQAGFKESESVMAASFKPPPREAPRADRVTPAESRAPRQNLPFQGLSEYKNKYKEWEMSKRESTKATSTSAFRSGPSPRDHQQERPMITTSQA